MNVGNYFLVKMVPISFITNCNIFIQLCTILRNTKDKIKPHIMYFMYYVMVSISIFRSFCLMMTMYECIMNIRNIIFCVENPPLSIFWTFFEKINSQCMHMSAVSASHILLSTKSLARTYLIFQDIWFR